MLGLDTNLPAVQNYFADVARYYVEKVGIDGWRNDSAAASPYHLFAKVRAAIQKVKPDAIMLAEESAAVDFETAFDMTYDFKFQTLLSKILDNPLAAAGGIRDVEASRSRFPAGAQQFRFFEWPGIDMTIPSSRCGTDCAVAFGTLLLTADGVPKINHGQEVGNTVPQRGPFVAPMNWDINPDAARYRARYQALGAIRSKYAVLRRGDFKALGSSDSRIATFARTLAGEQPIVTVINFANAAVEPKVDLSAGLSQANVRFMLVDLLDNTRIPVPDPKAFTLKLEPYKARVLQVVPDSR
jgi:glycosidase